MGLLATLLVAGLPCPARAGGPGGGDTAAASVCALVEAAAWRRSLPVSYFTRLIWQESRFKPDARSPVGALGIAQFMPATADGRGLADPFVVADALDESAAYLSELRSTFGNLGLAAAAYNAGPGRLSRWLAKQGDLPEETLDYVAIVTGHSVAYWLDPAAPDVAEEPGLSCRGIAATARGWHTADRGGSAPAGGKDWAVVLVANPHRDKVMAEFAMVRSAFSKVLAGARPSVVHRRVGGLPQAKYVAQIEHGSRAAADAFCNRLLRAGGACFVLANR